MLETIKNKVIHLNSQFTKDLPTASEDVDNIYISGYASVNTVDRVGDVVPSSVWEKGMANFLKNPVLLAHHDHSNPVGRVVEHKIDDKGLWVKARVSASSGEIFNKVKDGVITAFSVSFRILDAVYDSATELFVIKELELLELSVVSVPCNADTLFSLSKSFDNDEEYKLFKTLFVPKSESAKGLESPTVTDSTTSKELEMDPKDLEAIVAAAVSKGAQAVIEAQKAEKVLADKEVAEKAAKDAEIEAAVKKAMELVTPSTTGADALMADIAKKFEDQSATAKGVLETLTSQIAEKAAELDALQKSKMTFKDGKTGEVSYEDKEKAVILSKITGKSIEHTKFGKELLEKAGAHVASATWELEVSLNMEAEVRRKLVVAPIIRSINMKTNVMTIPVNPEAGTAQWMANSAFGTTTSAGNTAVHQLKEITLNAYKVATNEYLAYEEEEDSLLVLMPIVRDAMVRRVARSMDRAFLLGVGAGSDPVKGLLGYDATSAVNVTNTGAVGIANLRAARKDLGAWGLDTADVTYIVSTDVYYDLLEDTNFQTMDKVGTKATILTGQIGTVGNSPVLVSAEFPVKAGGANTATTNYAALAVAAGNFLVGNQRGLRFDTQDLVETQRKVLVASLRTGMTQVTTNLGQGVSAIRWS